MSERWRKPVIPVDIAHSPDQGIWLPDGRVHGEVQLTLSPEDIARARAGYVCLKCLEPFEIAWPERCPVCGAPIRTKQAEYFAAEFGGVNDELLKPTDWDWEIGGLEERRRKEDERRAKEGKQ